VYFCDLFIQRAALDCKVEDCLIPKTLEVNLIITAYFKRKIAS